MVLFPDRLNICHMTVKVHMVQLEHGGQTPQCEFIRAFPEEIQFDGPGPPFRASKDLQ